MQKWVWVNSKIIPFKFIKHIGSGSTEEVHQQLFYTKPREKKRRRQTSQNKYCSDFIYMKEIN